MVCASISGISGRSSSGWAQKVFAASRSWADHRNSRWPLPCSARASRCCWDGIQHGAGECDDAIVSVGGVIIVVIAVRANELFAQFVKHGTYVLAVWRSLIRAGARGGLYANRIVVDCGFVVGVTAGSGLVIGVCFIGVLAVSVFAEADVNVVIVIVAAGHPRVIQLRRDLLHRTHSA